MKHMIILQEALLNKKRNQKEKEKRLSNPFRYTGLSKKIDFKEFESIHNYPRYYSFWVLRLYGKHINNLSKDLLENNKTICPNCRRNHVEMTCVNEYNKMRLYRREICDECSVLFGSFIV